MVERFTKKNDDMGSYTQFGDKYIPNHNIRHKQCVEKLGKLEDIEQELGIPLEVLFKALKDGIWSTIKLNRLHKENQIFQFEHISLKLFEEGWGLVDLRQSFGETLTGTLVLLKDYGKTWWLEKPNEKVSD